MTVQKKDEEAFSFFKYKTTAETHIFRGKFTPTGCITSKTSICKKINNREQQDLISRKICLNEDEARKYAASEGRPICGVCVSDLYETYK